MPLAAVIAVFALLTGALVLAPVAAAQSTTPTLSATPSVTLPSPSPGGTTSTTSTTTSSQPQQLPRTGLDAWLIVLVGMGLVVAGTWLRAGFGGRRSSGRR